MAQEEFNVGDKVLFDDKEYFIEKVVKKKGEIRYRLSIDISKFTKSLGNYEVSAEDIRKI